jgi:hypothetical protein
MLFHRLFTAVNAVFLNLAGVYFRKPHVAKEGNQMDAQPSFVIVHIDAIALAFGDDLVFTLELGGCITECFLRDEFAIAEFAAQPQIPILGEVLGLREALLFCCFTPVPAGEVAGALPVTAVIVAFVDVNFSAENGVMLRLLLRPHNRENV